MGFPTFACHPVSQCRRDIVHTLKTIRRLLLHHLVTDVRFRSFGTISPFSSHIGGLNQALMLGVCIEPRSAPGNGVQQIRRHTRLFSRDRKCPPISQSTVSGYS